ncbi:polygalacturonase inhibitor-like [Silene latifolia]|uniref:polygalacturonase inhibitor-like n=1 Tax=Silene latifolia TaxID=37657 RepID=UPI003D76B9B4
MTNSKITLLCLTLLISTLTTSFSLELCNPSDKKVLLQIQQYYGKPEFLSSWSNDTDCCTDWFQVECDATSHRISSLTLFSGPLSGEISPLVGDLPFLTTLLFRHLTNISGPIPSTLAKLTNLNVVRLNFLNLTGPVPSFFSQLKQLTDLDLSFNQLSGSIPPSLSQLPNLGLLDLSRNQLTGSIPNSFGSFAQPGFTIDLSHNMLSGPIPSSLGNVQFLALDFSRNQLIGDVSFLFGTNKELNQFDLSRNMLSFNMSNLEFGSVLVLNRIDLNHNKIFGSLPKSLEDLPNLQFFNVSYNRLCGTIPTGGQLSQFDKYSYIHNKCLCGSPLQSCT